MPPDLLGTIQVVSGHFIPILHHGQIVASVEYDWVKDADDMMRADRGEPSLGGPVLYVSNLRVLEKDPTLIWMLRRRLPKARWIVGLTESWELRAPKGVPNDFFALGIPDPITLPVPRTAVC